MSRRYAVPVFAALTFVAMLPFGPLQAKSKEAVLYAFQGGADGANPFAGLTEDKDGNFYGAASDGGASGNGAVYRIAPDGTLTVLYSFAGGSDGAGPLSAPILDKHGNLYGVTEFGGGDCNCGIVYKLSRKGKETVLHTFTGQPDGFDPFASPVMDSQGNLYGTTLSGGTFYGSIYKIAPDGTETILYAFAGGSDGDSPYPGLTIGKDGNIYGATSFGGTHGFGTVFRMTPEGTKTILYNFAGGTSDVASPSSTPILDGHDNIYGAGKFGGGSCNCGAVYEIKRNGKEKLLHSFAGGSDGYSPGYGLTIDKAGNLYGATTEGGSDNCDGFGCGTIFKVGADGTESILYVFQGGNDGSTPDAAPVIDPLGNLYGTANYAGAGGYGVVYRLKQ
jgi:uncharacterized repeat protein (TIGR03803 family)